MEASRIRVRAERKLGEILKAMAANGQRVTQATAKSSSAMRLDDLGIPKDRASRAMQLADVPQEQFDAALAEPEVAQPRRTLKDRWWCMFNTLVTISALFLIAACGSRDYEDAQKLAQKGDYEHALPLLMTAAKAGNRRAQTNLGTIYALGKFVPLDYSSAVFWLTKASAQGDPDAECVLANMYYHGNGVEVDYKKAIDLYQKSAAQNIPEAAYNLGAAYHEGHGVPRDYAKGLPYLEASANQGSSLGQFALGQAIYSGQGAPINYKKAAAWVKKSADQGYSSAQLYLGLLYASGVGVEIDPVEAHKWINLASAQNEPGADTARTELESHMTQKQIAQAQKLAREWVKTSQHTH